MLIAGLVFIAGAFFGPLALTAPASGLTIAVVRPDPVQTRPAADAPVPPPADLNIERLSVPRLGLDAPVAVRGISAAGVMEDPHGPVEVAWYSVLSKPNRPGNLVLAGHRDYAGFGPAVFWRLRELAPGDELRVTLSGGSSVTYRVTSVASYPANNAPVGDIVGQTPTQTLTLLTCEGAFDSKTHQYDKRFVVKAKRV